NQVEVESFPSHELIVSPILHHLAFVQRDDEIGVPHGGQSVSDDHGCPALTSLGKQQGIRAWGLSMCWTKHQLRSMLSYLRQNGNTSLCHTYVWHLHDEVIGISVLASVENLCVGDSLAAVSDVLCDGRGEQDRLLPHQADVLAQPSYVDVSDVDAVKAHL
ncbi:hypothetical protein EGW08_002007, partial [Elysia chlorotica]